jgi:hypothetical protein
VAESTPELSSTQEYYVLLIMDEQGEATGIHWLEHRKFGNVLWLFSSMEVVEKFRGRYVDENQAFMGILERDFNQLREGATDINFFRAVSKATILDLLGFLFAADIDALILDPGADGWEQRVYKSPNKTYEEGGFE